MRLDFRTFLAMGLIAGFVTGLIGAAIAWFME